MSEYLSLFKSKTAESLLLEKYDLCLKQWPVPYQEEYIETEFGLTHLIKCGNEKGPVLVLMHGLQATAAMWIPNVKALSEKNYVIAVDILGDINKSRVKKIFKNNKDRSDWLIGVIDKLKIDKFSIMGLSYGSFLSMVVSLYEPQRVENLIIISPTQSITKLQKKMWFWILKVQLFPSDSNRRNFLRWYNAGKPLTINNDYTELQILGMKSRNFKKTYLIHLFRDQELLQIKIPVLLLIGNKEVVTDVADVKKRVERLIKNLTFRIIDDASHTLSIDKPEIVNPIILDFLSGNQAKRN